MVIMMTFERKQMTPIEIERLTPALILHTGRSAWSRDMRAKYIDSLIRGWDTPPIYLREVNETMVVVDGSNRVRAITDFIHDGFPVRSMPIIGGGDPRPTKPDGLKFTDAMTREPTMMAAFAGNRIPVTVIRGAEDDELAEFIIRTDLRPF
jgi:hypothetical protein